MEGYESEDSVYEVEPEEQEVGEDLADMRVPPASLDGDNNVVFSTSFENYLNNFPNRYTGISPFNTSNHKIQYTFNQNHQEYEWLNALLGSKYDNTLQLIKIHDDGREEEVSNLAILRRPNHKDFERSYQSSKVFPEKRNVLEFHSKTHEGHSGKGYGSILKGVMAQLAATNQIGLDEAHGYPTFLATGTVATNAFHINEKYLGMEKFDVNAIPYNNKAHVQTAADTFLELKNPTSRKQMRNIREQSMYMEARRSSSYFTQAIVDNVITK